MDRRDHWQSAYDSKGETAVSWFQECPGSSLRLIADSGLNRESRIVDVGGGASRLVDNLLDLGYRHITVLDVAETALALARGRLGRRSELVEWITADVTRWAPQRLFDLWHDRAVFHFLTEAADRQAYIAAMLSGVRSGGQAVIGSFAVDGPERCSGLPVRRYDADGIVAALAPYFRLADTLAEDHRTPGGKVQKFQFFRLVRL